MKKVLLLTALLCVGIIKAQEDTKDKFILEKGTWNLSGNFAFGFNDGDSNGIDTSSDENTTFIEISPTVGYFFNNNFQVGLGLGYGYRDSDFEFVNNGAIINRNIEDHTFSVYPYARKYFGLKKNFAFYLQGEGRYSRSSREQNLTEIPDTDFDSSSDSFFIGIRPGLTFFVSNSFAFETTLGSLGYTHTSFDDDGNTTGDFKSFDFNLSSSDLFFGLSYYF